jgi:ATP-dependent Clp protease adaptor protein ClpS
MQVRVLVPMAATAPLPTIAPSPTKTPERVGEPRITVRWLPPHKVIVHNNDHNTFEEVIGILMKAVPGMTVADAIEHTYTIHETGSSVPYRGMVDEAEKVATTIRSIGLKVTVEPDE